MGFFKRLMGGTVIAVFAISMIVPFTTVSAATTYSSTLSDSTINLLDRYVERYAERDNSSRMMISQRLGTIIEMIENGRVNIDGSRRMVLVALMYLDMQFDAVNDGNYTMQNYTMEQKDAQRYLESDGLMLEMQLGLLLKEHVDLGLNTLRNAYDASDDFQASFEQLDYNTNALADIIGSVYGDEAQKDFDELWTNHIGFFADYTVGLRDNNASLMIQAEQDLQGYVDDADEFFSNAIPSIMRGDLKAGANQHQSLLLRSMDAYDEGDYNEAYDLQREAHMQIGELAHVLAGGIIEQFPSQYDEEDQEAIMSKSGMLKKALTSLFIEHVALGLDTLRVAADGTDDFDDAYQALDDNTNDLEQAVRSIYGDDAGDTFDALWTDHIEFFANYTVAVETNDMEMKTQAERNLMQYAQDIDEFFSNAIPSIMQGEVMAGASEHKRLLLESIDAYAENDYEQAYKLQHESTMQVTGLGMILAQGIVKQFPERYEGEYDK